MHTLTRTSISGRLLSMKSSESDSRVIKGYSAPTSENKAMRQGPQRSRSKSSGSSSRQRSTLARRYFSAARISQRYDVRTMLIAITPSRRPSTLPDAIHLAIPPLLFLHRHARRTTPPLFLPQHPCPLVVVFLVFFEELAVGAVTVGWGYPVARDYAGQCHTDAGCAINPARCRL